MQPTKSFTIYLNRVLLADYFTRGQQGRNTCQASGTRLGSDTEGQFECEKKEGSPLAVICLNPA